jgi:hypothetical protein
MNKKTEVLLGHQMRVFEVAWVGLQKEESDLNDSFNIARNMACSEWSEAIIPSPTGGYFGLRPNKIKPETMKLLHKNYETQRLELSQRRYALLKLFQPIFKKTRHQITADQLECIRYWESQ